MPELLRPLETWKEEEHYRVSFGRMSTENVETQRPFPDLHGQKGLILGQAKKSKRSAR